MNEKIKFLLIVDCVFHISGRDVVVTGEVLKGQIKTGDELEVRSADKVIKTKCTRLEKYRNVITEANERDFIGVYLANVSKSDLARGMHVVIPN